MSTPGEEVSLRPLEVDDARAMASTLSDPALHAFTGGRPSTAEELARQYTVQTRGRSPDGSQIWLNRVILTGLASEPAGYVQATVPVDGGAAQVAWVVGVPWQGRGIGAAAARLLLDELAHLGVTRVVAHIHPAHRASRRTAERLGLTATGQVEDGEEVWTGTTE